jgi:pyruvate formate lyase activating enzyme
MFPELAFFLHKCLKCGRCILACPNGAITRSSEGEIVTSYDRCRACGKCVEVCMSGARKIVGKEMTVKEVVEEIKKDALFYSNSGGGVTLSGGDPIMQPEFSATILKICKEEGIHTCIETSAYGNWKDLAKILRYTDFLYVDIKHMNPSKHMEITGKSNDKILENISKVSKEYPNIPTIVRIPIIPGYTDDIENIKATALFVRELGDFKIELLPYHKLGIYRYDALSRPYILRDLNPPSHNYIQMLKEVIEHYGVETVTT